MMAAAAGSVAAISACTPPGQETPDQTTSGTDAGPEINTDLDSTPSSFTMRANKDQEGLWKALVEGFMEDHPKVTVDLTVEDFGTIQQNGRRYLNSANPPDLLRFPVPGDTVKDGLLLNLDPYARAYGWDKFPTSQLAQWLIGEDGRQRGSGSLYGLGLGFALVGIYYNKATLADLGLEVPTTLQEFYDHMGVAKENGYLPFVGETYITTYLYQSVLQQTGVAQQISDWVFNVPGATIDLPESVETAALLQEWLSEGYLPEDVLTVDGDFMFNQITNGDALFTSNGSWMVPAYEQAAPGKLGFFPMPGVTAGDSLHAASAPNGFVIATKAKNPEPAAGFLNWASTSEKARNAFVSLAGLVPGGPTDAPVPTTPDGSLLAECIAAFNAVSEDDGLVDFIANATAGMAQTFGPELQLLLSNKSTPQKFVDALQSSYEAALAVR